MKSPRHHFAQVNAPAGLIRRQAKADARREAWAATLPPVYAGPEPLSAWQTVLVLDADGEVAHRIALYVPTHGRCDQHAAEVDGERVPMLTATEIGQKVAAMIRKRPSLALLGEIRREGWA